jgi:hypothetical protein
LIAINTGLMAICFRVSRRKQTLRARRQMMNPRIILEILLAFALAFAVTFTLRVTGACAGGQRSIATFTARNGYLAASSITHGNKTDFYDARGYRMLRLSAKECGALP